MKATESNAKYILLQISAMYGTEAWKPQPETS